MPSWPHRLRGYAPRRCDSNRRLDLNRGNHLNSAAELSEQWGPPLSSLAESEESGEEQAEMGDDVVEPNAETSDDVVEPDAETSEGGRH